MSTGPVTVGYLGPEGTFSHEAALAGTRHVAGAELVPLATIYDVVMAVAEGTVSRAVVPLENSIEGSVSATLDTLAIDADRVRITAEQIHRIEQCLIAREPGALAEVATVLSHPQASAQCARFLHDRLPQARVMSTSSTADAVRMVAERGDGWAALGPRLAAARYGCVLLAEGVEDRLGNETRFVWLAPGGVPQPPAAAVAAPAGPAGLAAAARATGAAAVEPEPGVTADAAGRFKTSLLFWGDGTARPGWLVRCLSELSDRGVNLTRIESRPRKQGLGLYMFFIDCEGTADDPQVAAALTGLGRHTEVLRVLGSYPAA